MRLTLAAVGRMRAGPLRDVFDAYARRLGWSLTVREIEVAGGRSGAALAAAEAEKLRSILPPAARIVALDERGRNLASVELAEVLGRWRDSGTRDVCFLIGGADGLDAALRAQADLVISFGRQTWPHLMVRVMLIEQIYRAETILAGHPYHRA